MRITLPLNAVKLQNEILSKSSVKIFRKQQPPTNTPNSQPSIHNDKTNEYRENPLGIQMLSKSLYEQVFLPNHDAATGITSETIDR